MGYADTSGIVIYWNPDQIIFIHRAHSIYLDEYDYRIFIQDNHTRGYLLLQQDPETHIYNSDILNLNLCELDLTYTTFFYTTIITYEIELPPSGNKVGLNLLNDEDVTIPYITDKITNSSAGNQLPT